MHFFSILEKPGDPRYAQKSNICMIFVRLAMGITSKITLDTLHYDFTKNSIVILIFIIVESHAIFCHPTRAVYSLLDVTF